MKKESMSRIERRKAQQRKKTPVQWKKSTTLFSSALIVSSVGTPVALLPVTAEATEEQPTNAEVAQAPTTETGLVETPTTETTPGTTEQPTTRIRQQRLNRQLNHQKKHQQHQVPSNQQLIQLHLWNQERLILQ